MSREPEGESEEYVWDHIEDDDEWLDDEETDADDDTPLLDGGNDVEWEGDDDDDEWDEEC